MTGLSMELQDVAVKKCLDQDLYDGSLVRFKSEVSNYYYIRMLNAFKCTFKIHSLVLPSTD